MSTICTCTSRTTTPDTNRTPAPQRDTAPEDCPLYPTSSMTDAQWALIAPLLPPPGNTAGRGGRGEKWPRRLILDAIFYLVRGGIAWAALPRDFPPYKTVFDWFTRWKKTGVWADLHDALRDRARLKAGRAPQPSAAVIDSASVRGADTVPARSRGYDAGKKVNGRKRHIAVDSGGLLLVVIVTVAGLQDRDAAHRLAAAVRAKFSTITLIWADGGYAGRFITWAKTVLHLDTVVVKRSDDATGFTVLPRRWVVERTFAWISKYRRCVRDYETRADTHETMVQLSMIMLMSRRLAR